MRYAIHRLVRGGIGSSCFLIAVFVFGSAVVLPGKAGAATINVASCSQSAVQAAVNTAVDGDKVVIPNGSCAWSGGISTTKQIRIEAQNYTPTPGGTMTRNVTITNNSSVPLLTFTSGNSYHVGVTGIRFNEGSGNGNHLRLMGSGRVVFLKWILYSFPIELLD